MRDTRIVGVGIVGSEGAPTSNKMPSAFACPMTITTSVRNPLGRNPFQVPCGRGGLLGQQLRSSKRLYLGLLLLLLLPEIVLYLHL